MPVIISCHILRSDSYTNTLSEELWGSGPLQRHRLLPRARVQKGTRRREQQKGECERTEHFVPFWFHEMLKDAVWKQIELYYLVVTFWLETRWHCKLWHTFWAIETVDKKTNPKPTKN